MTSVGNLATISEASALENSSVVHGIGSDRLLCKSKKGGKRRKTINQQIPRTTGLVDPKQQLPRQKLWSLPLSLSSLLLLSISSSTESTVNTISDTGQDVNVERWMLFLVTLRRSMRQTLNNAGIDDVDDANEIMDRYVFALERALRSYSAFVVDTQQDGARAPLLPAGFLFSSCPTLIADVSASRSEMDTAANEYIAALFPGSRVQRATVISLIQALRKVPRNFFTVKERVHLSPYLDFQNSTAPAGAIALTGSSDGAVASSGSTNTSMAVESGSSGEANASSGSTNTAMAVAPGLYFPDRRIQRSASCPGSLSSVQFEGSGNGSDQGRPPRSATVPFLGIQRSTSSPDSLNSLDSLESTYAQINCDDGSRGGTANFQRPPPFPLVPGGNSITNGADGDAAAAISISNHGDAAPAAAPAADPDLVLAAAAAPDPVADPVAGPAAGPAAGAGRGTGRGCCVIL